ncbi:cache domain-containing protein [Nocardioides mangrovi]|uniref:Cache domain-containing protein n=1 Tax=Nocardioides mangrovi TaxID=2874580 RepID=A0ABS7U7T0_9ACTN|nr:cache domain-containing protein [Nocardioides mangrovi]MBZ5736996.1 cache domain-containing protein [Nocardioides mangrovi]
MTSLPSTVSDSLSGSVARCAIAVTAYFGALFGSLEGIGEQVLQTFTQGRTVSAAALSEVVEPLARTTLAGHPVVGAGFVVTPGVLTDRELHLAWWQGEEQQPLPERGVPIGHHVFDYTRHEWFRTPLATGLRHVTGPYVDYVCTDEYVLTATVPVLLDGRMIGVAGADTRLETFEQLMRAPLQDAGAVALVNTHDRIVVAADPLLRSGQKVDPASYAVAHPLPGLPFRVLDQT